jgi:hypothetical protein
LGGHRVDVVDVRGGIHFAHELGEVDPPDSELTGTIASKGHREWLEASAFV